MAVGLGMGTVVAKYVATKGDEPYAFRWKDVDYVVCKKSNSCSGGGKRKNG